MALVLMPHGSLLQHSRPTSTSQVTLRRGGVMALGQEEFCSEWLMAVTIGVGLRPFGAINSGKFLWPALFPTTTCNLY